MRIQRDGYPLPIDERLFGLLEVHLEDIDDAHTGAVHLDFEPCCCGDHRPVSIELGPERIDRIIEYDVQGNATTAWDFARGLHAHRGTSSPIAQSERRWRAWQQVFLVAQLTDAYAVTVEPA